MEPPSDPSSNVDRLSFNTLCTDCRQFFDEWYAQAQLGPQAEASSELLCLQTVEQESDDDDADAEAERQPFFIRIIDSDIVEARYYRSAESLGDVASACIRLRDFLDRANKQSCHFCTVAAHRLFPDERMRHAMLQKCSTTDQYHLHYELPLDLEDHPFPPFIKVSGDFPDTVDICPSLPTLVHPRSLSLEITAEYLPRVFPVSSLTTYDIAQSTGSDVTFQRLRRLLKECMHSHTKCKPPYISPNSRPDYLLKVCPATTGTPSTCRLVATTSLPQSVEWVTLSYCWGTTGTFRNTQSTRESLLRGISVKSLPTSIRHAMETTVRLGQRYIWIDALCIEQDSPTHFRAQAAIMGDIYGSSVFTIAAVCSKDVSEGCFRRLDPLARYPLTVDLAGADKNNDRCLLLMRKNYGSPKNTPVSQLANYRWTVPEDEPLHTRGWTMQEYLLSPRLIVFGSDKAYLLCSSLEPHKSDIPSSDDHLTRLENLCTIKSNLWEILHPEFKLEARAPQYRRPKFLVPHSSSWLSFRVAYWHLVEEYTHRHLSFAIDKLVAIQGLIGKISDAVGLENVWGLWRQSLVSDLLWQVPRGSAKQTVSGQRGKFSAPTWSWASIDSRVAYSRQILHHFVWKNQFNEEPLRNDHFWPVRSCQLEKGDGTENIHGGQHGPVRIKLKTYIRKVKLLGEHYLTYEISDDPYVHDNVYFYPDTRSDNPDVDVSGDDLWAICIYAERYGRVVPNRPYQNTWRWFCQGLVLKEYEPGQNDGTSPRRYVRVGLFDESGSNMAIDWWCFFPTGGPRPQQAEIILL